MNESNNDWSVVVAVGLICYILFRIFGFYKRAKQIQTPPTPPEYNLTALSLSCYDGRDPFRPLLLAIKGKIYDVTEGSTFYGPGGGYHVFAGRECARALAKMSTSKEDCNDDLDDLTESEFEVLDGWIRKLEKYPVVGKIVPLQNLTLDQLREFDGTDKEKPMYLAIKGTIFDVSKAPQFYGPDGMYPFAGRECARAFALYSTELDDCNDNLEGLDASDIDAMNDWFAKFVSKYDIIGEVVK
ncbi:hypothetical protein BSKO_00781 [Bryopsis sp. KO-2023]|nr:hypothetical protein BSKO_00781 [Bryopsis sp. KO-2023]